MKHVFAHKLLTNNTTDEWITPGFHADHLAIFSATFGPTANGDLSLYMRILLLQSNELVEATFLNIEFLVENKFFPSNVAYADERIDNVRTHISGDVVDAIAAYVRTIDSPIAKIAHQPWSFWNINTVFKIFLIIMIIIRSHKKYNNSFLSVFVINLWYKFRQLLILPYHWK